MTASTAPPAQPPGDHRTVARTLVAVLLIGAVICGCSSLTGSGSSSAPPCTSPDTAPRNPANPLDTPHFHGGDPLAGAHLFVESPWLYGGDAADAIADEVGLGALSRQEGGSPTPWAQFKHQVGAMHLSPTTAHRVRELEKIGDYPQAHQFSIYTAGGSGSAIDTQVQNYLCRIQRTDPGAAAVITTYFVDHRTGCSSGAQPRFDAEVGGLKAAVGDFPALIFVEEDGIDTICWSQPAAVKRRTALLKDEIDQLSQLPHALVYVEGGTVDADSPAQVAAVLKASDAVKTRGFFLGDTHFNWAYQEIAFGDRVSALTGGLHFVVDTRADGQGPILNRHPETQGIEELCNPPHRGLGPPPGASDGSAYGMSSRYLDGFVWVTSPGESAAPTCPGRSGHWAPSGVFDANLASDYAAHADARIGPSPPYPSRPW